MDTVEINSHAWDKEVEKNNWWTRIVSKEIIDDARNGKPRIWVTPTKDVPLSWISELKGKKVLNACGGGGQQTPVLSAFGSTVTTLDMSLKQLEQDKKALEMYSLSASLVHGSVLDLPFDDESFDGIINPCSLNFVEDLDKVYSEFSRVLKKGGQLIIGIVNPILYMFDEYKQEKKLIIKYTLPFSHSAALSEREINKRIKRNETFEFSHTLDSILGGLFNYGFTITGFFSDKSGSELTDSYTFDPYFAFMAKKNN